MLAPSVYRPTAQRGVQSMEQSLGGSAPAWETSAPGVTMIIWHGTEETLVVDDRLLEPNPEAEALRAFAKYHLRKIDCPFPPEE